MLNPINPKSQALKPGLCLGCRGGNSPTVQQGPEATGGGSTNKPGQGAFKVYYI